MSLWIACVVSLQAVAVLWMSRLDASRAKFVLRRPDRHSFGIAADDPSDSDDLQRSQAV